MNALKRTSRARWVGGLLFILCVALAPAAAWAQTLTTLYTFSSGSDGGGPNGGESYRDRRLRHLSASVRYLVSSLRRIVGVVALTGARA